MRTALLVLLGAALALGELAPDPIVRPVHSHVRARANAATHDHDHDHDHDHTSRAPHACVHDSVVADALAARGHHGDGARSLSVTGEQSYSLRPSADGHGRRALDNTWAPIRIRAEFVDVTGPSRDPEMTDELANFLTNALVPAAINRLSTLLSVRPVQGPLFAYRACTGYYTSTTPFRCSGLSSDSTCGYLGTGDISIIIPSEYFGAQTYWTGSAGNVEQTTPAGSGVEDSDFVMFISAAQLSGRCGAADGGTVAFALSCQRDQYDRPTFGRANFCPARLSTDPAAWGDQLGVAVHEFLHALGFSADSWPLFRDADDPELAPRTPRNPGIPSLPEDSYRKTYTCSGVTGQQTRYVADGDTVGYATERGSTCTSVDDVLTQGISACVGRIVTPRVQVAARTHFGCADLAGAELENQDTTPCALQGSHWEQRVFNGEVMTPFSTHTSFISSVTLATLEDSGWYVANYSAAAMYTQGVDFAYRQGCALARDNKCLTPGNPPVTNSGSRPHYCTVNGAVDCTFDNRAVGKCYAGAFSGPLPSNMQYWTNDATYGANNPIQTDFCPIVKAFDNRRCGIPSLLPANSDVFAYYYGDNSMCLRSTLHDANYVVNNPTPAGCFRYRCVPIDENNQAARLDIIIPRIGGGAAWAVPCYFGNETYSVTGYNGNISCADPRAFCAAQSTVDPDLPGVIQMRDPEVLALKRAGTVSITLQRLSGSARAVSVLVSTMPMTAPPSGFLPANSSHYVPITNQSVAWASGDQSDKVVSVQLISPPPGNATMPLVFMVTIVDSQNVTVLTDRSSTTVKLYDILPSPSPVPTDDDDGAATASVVPTFVVLLLALASLASSAVHGGV